ncbi:MAG: hypothetical protein WBV78_04210, partial [Roseobacter sp.]
SFAAQSANGRNVENRLFAAVVANVSVAGQIALSLQLRQRLLREGCIEVGGHGSLQKSTIW